MKSLTDLDRLLETMEVSVEAFTASPLSDERRFPAPRAGLIAVHHLLSGSARVAFAGRTTIDYAAGATILVPPGIETRFQPTASGAEATVASGTVAVRLSLSFGLLDRATAPIIEPLRATAIDAQLCRLMLGEAAKAGQEVGAAALRNAAMKMLILMVLRGFFKRPGIDQKIISALADPRLVGPVTDVIDRVSAPHSVASLAESAGLGTSSFLRHFSGALGMTPMEFVTRARLHHAATLLRSTDMPVKSVAGQVGFASRSHFSKAFQALYGDDPTAYREMERVGDEQARPVDYRSARADSRLANT